MTEGQQRNAASLAQALKTLLPNVELDFDVLTPDIVKALDLEAVDYIDERRQAFDKALTAILKYDSDVASELRQQIGQLRERVAATERRLAPLVTTGQIDP